MLDKDLSRNFLLGGGAVDVRAQSSSWIEYNTRLCPKTNGYWLQLLKGGIEMEYSDNDKYTPWATLPKMVCAKGDLEIGHVMQGKIDW